MTNKHLLKSLLPTVAGVLVIGSALFFLLLPKVQSALVDTKMFMVRSMAQSAWSVLYALHERVDKGELTLEEAQERGKSIIHSMRYDFEPFFTTKEPGKVWGFRFPISSLPRGTEAACLWSPLQVRAPVLPLNCLFRRTHHEQESPPGTDC